MKDSRPVYNRLRHDSGQHRRLLVVTAVLALLAFIPAALRLYDLMIRQYDLYFALAQRNQTRTTAVTAQRGTITDRNGNLLAISQSVENVYLNPNELYQSREDLQRIAAFLAQELQQNAGEILKKAQDRTYRYQQVGKNVSRETAGRIREFIAQNDIQGIHLEPSARRVYPYGSLASQLIGFTNAESAGSEGIEAAYNSYLSGSAGKVITTKGNNEMDMPYSYEDYIRSVPGADVTLTLDMTVQAALERHLQRAVASYDVQNGAFGLVMNVDTGEILAMATLGGYDPNQYLEIADGDTAQQLEQMRLSYLREPMGSETRQRAYQLWKSAMQDARLKQWRNRCVADGYEPGSTFKTLTLAAALDTGAVTLKSGFHCGGSAHIPGRAQLLHCWRSAGHGSQTTAQALQNSCNLAFANIALKLGGERFYEYITNFGVTEKTGIDLYGESGGVFFAKELVTNTEKYGTASLTSGSFGQTFKLTPLQLVRGIAAVVNGGYLLEPYIVSQVTDHRGNVLLEQTPTVLRRCISQETSDTMCALLESVVTEGTAKNAQVAGYRIGGKTGTSEKIDFFDENGNPVQDKIVSFVGIAPMDDPRYIVLVALDTPSRKTGIYISGGVMAAPTAGGVLAEILPYLGVARVDKQPDVTIPDLIGSTQKEAEKTLKDLGLAALCIGSEETVTGQIPEAGTALSPGTQVILYLGQRQTQTTATVPDFTGMTVPQANEAAVNAGLCILARGNPDLSAPLTVHSQDTPAGTQVPIGTTILLKFIDPSPSD